MNLTFCIPTRNRADTISQTLDSILSQAKKNIEIVIVDGASTDNTSLIVKEYKNIFQNIIYYKREKCVGVDKDIAKSIELSKGPFCWLMSDDDILLPGTIEYIKKHLKKYSEISGLSTNYIQYDNKLKFPVATVPASNGNRLKQNTFFYNAETCFSNIGNHIGFLSCQIVKRDHWMKIIRNNDLTLYQNNWMMVYVIGKIIQGNKSWHYIHRNCIGQRTGNDSFMKGDVYKRELITHLDYSNTISGIFGRDSKVYSDIFFYLASDRLPRIFANLKAKNIDLPTQIQLFKLYYYNYRGYISFWLKVFPLFMIPNIFFMILRKLYFQSRILYNSKK